MSNSVQPHRRQPTRLPCPWDFLGKNTGVGCHFPLQCMKVKSESEVTQFCLTPSDPMDCSLPGSSVHGIFQAGVLEWVAISFTRDTVERHIKKSAFGELRFRWVISFISYCKFLREVLWLFPLYRWRNWSSEGSNINTIELSAAAKIETQVVYSEPQAQPLTH